MKYHYFALNNCTQVYQEDEEKYWSRKVTLQNIRMIRVHLEGWQKNSGKLTLLKTMAAIKTLTHLWLYALGILKH